MSRDSSRNASRDSSRNVSRCSSRNSSRVRREHIDDVLEGARTILTSGKDALDLAPIPGLGLAAGAINELIGMVLKTKGNKKAQKELSDEIKVLSEKMIDISKKSAATIDDSEPTHREQARKEVKTSSELRKRVDDLVKILKDVTEEIGELSKHNVVVRFLRSNRDEEALKGFTERIRTARMNFMRAYQQLKTWSPHSYKQSIAKVCTSACDIIRNSPFHPSEEDEDTLRALPIAEASYQSVYTQSKTHYLDGTRVDILDELEKWAKADTEFAKTSVYILSGLAGTGKSTIACEMAKRLDKVKLLGASFFFIRGIEKLSTIHFVIPTIAFQLAKNIPELHHHIVDAVRAYVRSNETMQLEHQLDALLVEPLRALPSNHDPLVIIIDAVDECTQSGQDDVARLLYLLMKNIHQRSLPLRILLTTRPEIHIETPLYSTEFHNIARPFKLQDIPLDVVSMDIARYVEAELSKSRFKAELKAERPKIVAELTGKAAGLFIYASVACDFIFKSLRHKYSKHAVERLNQWLSETSTVSSMTKPLDMLYLNVLQQSFPESNYSNMIQDVLASVALLQDQVSPQTLESLTGIPVDDVMDIVSQMASVILPCDDTNIEIQPVHASFPQFLIDNARCTDPQFFINPLTHHQAFASKCLALLIKPGVLQMKQQVPVPAHVAYACLHWPAHMVSSQASNALLILLQEFLKRDLLLWFGALSVMGRLRSAAPALSSVQQWVQNITGLDVDKKIPTLLNDGYRFILEYIVPIEMDPMQIYISALPIMPTCLLQELYTPKYQHMPALQLITKRDSGWGPCLCVMEGHTFTVPSVKYSPDGHYIVTCSYDETLCTWQADSGTPLNIMRGHDSLVNAVDFCPDPHRPAEVVSVSQDKTLCIWDFASGAPLHSISPNEGYTCVAYSPDGKKIVAGSRDRGFKIWDAVTREQLLQADNISRTNSISFSPDGKLIVTAWRNIHIWNADTGDLVCTLEGHTREFRIAIFSPDGIRVVSGAYDRTLFIWDVKTGRCLRVLGENTSSVYAIAISPKGDIIASGGGDSTICLWDADSGELLNILKGHTSTVMSLCFSPNGHTLASASDDKTVCVWDIVGHSSGIRKAEEPLPAISCVELSSDGTIIATGSEDGSVSIWETQTGKQLHHIQLETKSDVWSLAILPDNQTVACATDEDDFISIWNISIKKLSKKPLGDGNSAYLVECSLDGQWIASVTESNIHLWCTSEGDLEHTIPMHSSEYEYGRSLAFSSDSKMLQCITNQKHYICDISTGTLLGTETTSWVPQTSEVQFREENGWIIAKTSGKKLAWIAGSKRGWEDNYTNATFRFHGKYYAVGSKIGQFTIIDLSKLED
ncbi:hypothetical protein QCA50_009742 [Cerrena zonata]|uniref:Nephrocystin 3-like N-terminal domain-containing protein n=1 Tax=Cerrena zonata TaxID=2478898 RepID=A0AAW0GBE4_9APHY